jgi:TRAP transporter TAXI family solute receptor
MLFTPKVPKMGYTSSMAIIYAHPAHTCPLQHAHRCAPHLPIFGIIMLCLFLNKAVLSSSRRCMLALTIFCICAGAAHGQAAENEKLTFMRIGTGPMSGALFPIGGMIANAISNPPGSRACDKGGSCGVPGMIAVAQSTNGSIENVRAIQSGDLGLALAQADIAYWGFYGLNQFKGSPPLHKLRAIAMIFSQTLHAVTLKSSPLTNFKDLKGKTIALASDENSVRTILNLVLASYHIPRDSVTLLNLETPDALQAVINGQADLAFINDGAPIPSLLDASEDVPLKLLPIAGPEAENLADHHPFLTRMTFHEDTYPDMEPTQSLHVGTLLLTSADISKETIYGITRAIWHKNSKPMFLSGHDRVKGLRMENAVHGISIPLHPGAVDYYFDAGLF